MNVKVEKREFHKALRQRACTAVQEALAMELPGLRLSDINADAAQQAGTWNAPLSAPTTAIVPPWEWRRLWRKFSRKACRVDLAVWHNNDLYGLAIGRISPRRVVATIHYLQRSPISDKFFSLGRIATAYLVALGQELGCREVAVDRPLEELLDYYKDLGFTVEVTKGKRVIKLIYPLNTVSLD